MSQKKWTVVSGRWTVKASARCTRIFTVHRPLSTVHQILATILSAALFLTAGFSTVLAHPLAQGRMELIIFPGHATLWARVPVEQVIVQQLLPTRPDEKIDTPSEVYRKHGEYLLKHVFVQADGAPLSGKINSIAEPESRSVHPLDAEKEYATYEIEYALPGSPALIEISQNVLNEVDFTPGNRWEATYILGIRQDQKKGLDNLLLSCRITLPFSCDWSAPAKEPTTLPTVSKAPEKNTPPAELNGSLEAPPNRSHFWLGLLTGIGGVVLLSLLWNALRKTRNS